MESNPKTFNFNMENYPKTPDCMLDPREIIRNYLKAKYNEHIIENKSKSLKKKLKRGKHVGIFEGVENFF